MKWIKLLYYKYINKTFSKIDKPSNLEQCFISLYKNLSKEDLNLIRSMSESDLVKFHHTFGRSIRNKWGLWSGGPLRDYFNTIGLFHPDDMSSVIINCFWRHIRNMPLELESQIQYYQNYWKGIENELNRIVVTKKDV